jgi:protein SCO1/2
MTRAKRWVCLLWLVCWTMLGTASHADALFLHGEAPRPGLGGSLELTDHHGQRFSLKQLAGQPALVFFGFSHCTTVCPTALFQARQMLDSFQSRRAPAVLFVSLDPLSDDPASLGKFLAAFDTRIVGLTGPPSQVERAATHYGVAMQGQGERIEHSARWYLLDADAHVARVYDSATPGRLLAQDLVRAQNALKLGTTKGMP